MLEQLYNDINTCQPVSVQQTYAIINSTIQIVLPFTKSVDNTWKHSFFATFNIGFSPLFFPLFCKISVKGWVAELKVKMAKKLRKFLSTEISTFEYNLYTNSICLLGRFLDNLPSFQHQIVKKRGLAHPVAFEWLCRRI